MGLYSPAVIPDEPSGGVPPQKSSVPPHRSTGGTVGWSPPSVEQLQCLLANYEIIDVIGQGGMGAVYVGRQLSLDRLVAIKILPAEALKQAGSEDAVDRFKNEARSMARMNHPGIVGVYDFGETPDDQFYLVMEHVDGTDVAQMILSQGRLPDEHALSITAHVCDALHYAHSHGVIHRDIKPANILLNREGQVKIADFGLAKRTESGSRGITRTNMTMGTPDFIAPEALIEGLTVDHRSDIYSVGVMLYNMLTGEVPRGMFKMPSAKAGSDPRFDAIVLKAVQAERDERYQTVQEMRRDLDVILTIPMAKVEKTGPAPVPSRSISSKVPARPVATGPRKVPTGQRPAASTGPKPMAGQAKAVTAAHRPAQGAAPGGAAPRPAGSPAQGVSSRGKPAAPNPVLLFGGIAGAVAAVLGGWWMIAGGTHKTGQAPQFASSGGGDRSTTQPSSSASSSGGTQQNSQSSQSKPASSGGGVLPSNFTALREVPRDRWFKILTSREAVAKRKNVEWKDGWIHCRGDNELLGFTDLGGSHDVQNIALKCVVRPPDAGKEWMWTFREGSRGSYRLVVRADHFGLDYDDRSAGTGRTVHLREGSFSKELASASQWSLEATIRGERFSVSLNGREVFSQDKLKLLEAGSCWMRTGGSGNLIFKDAAFKILPDTVESPVVAGADGPPAGVMIFKSHRYQVVPAKLRWSEAKARAESMGGHLATITSREEHEWISNTFIKLLPEGVGLWLGGTNSGTPTKWKWITGESFSFTAWDPDEPSNRKEETALMFWRNDSGRTGWLDLREEGIGNKDRRWGFLLEMDDPDAGNAGAGLASAAATDKPAEKPPAAPDAPPPSPAAPSSEFEKRLAQIESQFQSAYDRDIGKAHAASIADFDGKYRDALDRAVAASTKEGRLDEASKLSEEKQRVADKRPLPPAETDSSQPGSLKQLRATYRSTLRKMEAERDRKAQPYYDRYDQLLEAYQKELTQQQKYDDAIRVKSLRVEWSAKRPKADDGSPAG